MLSRSELKTLINQQAQWCVSLFMPTHRAGAETQQDPVRLKNLLQEAEEQLSSKGLRRPEIENLLAPARELVSRFSFWQHQSDGLALFVSPEVFYPYRLPLDFEALTVVADRFHVKPLLPLVSGDGKFYVLALSQNEIRLLQGTRYNVGQVDLPQVPQSLAQVLKWDDPEKRLQWHTGTSARTDGRSAIFHGHGVASEDDPKEHILRYFRRIDEGLSEILAEERAPLVLAGVDYLHSLYQEANSYRYLIEQGIIGSPKELSAEELHQQAWAIVEPLFQEEQEKAAAQFKQLAGQESERASQEIKQVVPAAYHGRAELVFVGVGIQKWGTFDPQSNRVEIHQQAEPGDIDLLDLAAVHTFSNNGTVYAVEMEQMPGDAPLAAVFRY